MQRGKDSDGLEITIGKLSNLRRVRMCAHYDHRIKDIENDGVNARLDERFCRNWSYTMTGREPHNSFTLTMPNGLSCIIDGDGRFESYRDHDGIAQDMTEELAIQFDDWLVEVTGITSNKHMTN